MTTQVPLGPENAVVPHGYPPLATEHSQQLPAPSAERSAGPGSALAAGGGGGVSAPPADHPVEHNPAQGNPAQSYPTAGNPAAGNPAAGNPTEGYPVGAYPAVSYPQESAASYPVPVPYPQPGAHPPPTAYPTAPPWAAAQPQPAAGAPNGPVSPSAQPLPQHGGLLVPYPDEMQHAARAHAPAVWPVAVFTLLFSILGLASAKRRADQARRTRNSPAPYWIAFLIAAAAGAFIWFVIAAVVIGPLLTDIRENGRLEAVQRNVVGDGQLEDARIDVTAARCRAVTDRNAEGMRDYLCQLTLAGGKTASLTLTADESGQWHSGSGT